MRPEDPTSDGAAGPTPPWAAAFDPAANVRALTDLQRSGLEAAQVLIERFVQTMDSRASVDIARPAAPAGTAGPVTGIDGLVDLWADLVKSTLRGFLTQIATNAGGPPAPGLDDRVRMVLDRRDGELARGSAPMWLHNISPTARDQLRPHCGELRSAAGAQLQARITFDPPVVDALAAGASALVTVRVDDADGAPGSYRGVVLAAGLDDLWLNLEVVVP
jgi:hypothetical protein